jgi:hypothetical protein
MTRQIQQQSRPRGCWYARFFGREPDARPMDGLVEWHLHDAFGIQVWLDPERAGRSTMVLEESNLDGRSAELEAEDLSYEGPQAATASRIVQLDDPDGNPIVITGD